jgi:hypothetical protein
MILREMEILAIGEAIIASLKLVFRTLFKIAQTVQIMF